VQQNLNAARLADWGWPKALANCCSRLKPKPTGRPWGGGPSIQPCCPNPVTALSGGQRQRLAIARLLRQEPGAAAGR